MLVVSGNLSFFGPRSQRNRAGFRQCVCCGGHATWSLTLPDACSPGPMSLLEGDVDLNLKLPAAGNKANYHRIHYLAFVQNLTYYAVYW